MSPPRALASVRAARLCVLGSVLGVGACTSGASAPPGFSTAYAALAAGDGGAPPAFRSVRGSGAGNGWAVGEGGLAVALASGRWIPVDSGTTATLGGLSMVDGAHAFAVELGGPRVVAWNGIAWAPVGADRADRAAAATWTAGGDDVWVVGNGIEHWDGTAWTQQVPGVAGGPATFTSISGSFSTDIWAVGPAGVEHYDGHAWAPVAVPASTPALAAVWVVSLDNALIVGAQGTVFEVGGGTFVRLPAGPTVDLTAIGGTGPTDVWVGGVDGTLAHWDGATWAELLTPAQRPINDLWAAAGADGLLFVDDTGTVTSYVP